jgi:hypothetical protein
MLAFTVPMVVGRATLSLFLVPEDYIHDPLSVFIGVTTLAYAKRYLYLVALLLARIVRLPFRDLSIYTALKGSSVSTWIFFSLYFFFAVKQAQLFSSSVDWHTPCS